MPQCSNCQFQNMPGTTHCGRCGASLLLATALIDVHPPRATRWSKTWRKSRFWHIWHSLNHLSADLARRVDVSYPSSWPSIMAAVRLIVPGWPQLAGSKVNLGRFLLGGYLSCGLLAAVCYGTTIGSFFIAVAITIHSIGLYDVAQSSSKVRTVRISRILLGCGLIGLFLYLPLFNLVPQYAAPFAIRVNREPLRVGDVLLSNRNAYVWARPRVGDIVLYELNPVRVPAFEQGRNAVLNLAGQRVDRVLAVPGQSIVCDGRTLTVDGQPAPHRPLNLTFSSLQVSLIVPPDHYFIIPSGERIDGLLPNNENIVRTLSLIPITQIEGRVYWRNYPWSRMGRIR